MAASIGCNDMVMFNWAATVPFGIFLDQIQPDGRLPMEVSRGQMATSYHAFAAASVTTMSYLATPNGVDLYSKGDYAVSRLNTLVAK